jgi:hypothetical protein
MKKKSTYFSSWIRNFGVVPLFLFLAFLFWPIFVFLFFLFDSVTAVFETISISLTKIVNLFNNPKCLPSLQRTVKRVFSLLILVPSLSYGSDNVLISKGEIKEIKIKSLTKLTLGNPEIVSQSFNPKKESLLLRGKKIGYTELKIWTHGNISISFHIYVISKNLHLKLTQNLEILGSMGLKTRLQGTIISVEGILRNEENRRMLLMLLKKYPDLINSKVQLSDELKNSLYQKIFSYFSKSNLGQMECQNENMDIICMMPKSNEENLELKKYVSVKYDVKFIARDQGDFSNYLLKLKIIQIERQNGEAIGLNLDNGPGILKDLFKTGLKQYLILNNVNFESTDMEISTLAEPEIISLIGQKSKIEIGADISFPSKNETNKALDWKFAGIKTELELKRVGNLFQLQYRTQMTKPNGEASISGNKESSSAMIELEKPIQLFQIGFKTEGRNSEGFPFFQHIPILREIFGTTSSHSTYKRITGFILLEEYGNTKK